MKAQRRLGPALSWPRITLVFLTDVAVLVLASHLPGARVVPARALRDHEQVAVRVGPRVGGAAPQTLHEPC